MDMSQALCVHTASVCASHTKCTVPLAETYGVCCAVQVSALSVASSTFQLEATALVRRLMDAVARIATLTIL